jgi:hypothetical protein
MVLEDSISREIISQSKGALIWALIRVVGAEFLERLLGPSPPMVFLGDGEKAMVFGKVMGFWRRARYTRILGVIWIACEEILDTLAHTHPGAK